MKGQLKQFLKFGVRVVEILLSPLLILSAIYLKLVRSLGMWRIPFSRDLLLKLDLFPIRNQYYDPWIDVSAFTEPLDRDRILPGIDMNESDQLQLLTQMHYSDELRTMPSHVYGAPTKQFGLNKYYYGGDADFYYSMVRFKKPKRIAEIGSGYSTLVALNAIEMNRKEDASYRCAVSCIEPFANAWLEKTGVSVFRKKVEQMERKFFEELGAGDILFIDSSHVIRPQGDVLFEYLELLPSIPSGVLIHIHDIFTPKEYPEDWLKNEFRFHNEQYLVEAFLSYNSSFQIIAALHYLYHTHFEAMKKALPHVERLRSEERQRAPSSLWLERV